MQNQEIKMSLIKSLERRYVRQLKLINYLAEIMNCKDKNITSVHELYKLMIKRRLMKCSIVEGSREKPSGFPE